MVDKVKINEGKRVDIVVKNDRRRRGKAVEVEKDKFVLYLSGQPYTHDELRREINYVTLVCSDSYLVDMLKANGYEARISDRYSTDFHISLCGVISDLVIREAQSKKIPVSDVIETGLMYYYKINKQP